MIPFGNNSIRLTEAMTKAAQILFPDGRQDDCARPLHSGFGSSVYAIESGEEEMARVAKMESPLAFVYSIVPSLARRILTERTRSLKAVRTLADVRTYILPLYLGMHYECGYILCLDANGALLSARQLRLGTVSEAPLYIRVIAESALQSGGEYCILVHNHPAGSCEPSPSDCISTFSVMSALKRLDLLLIDHVIFADGKAVSIRASGLIEKWKWEQYAPLPELYKGWPD